MSAAITLSTYLAASPQAIFEALTRADGLASFWTPDVEVGQGVGSVAVFGFGQTQLKMRIDYLAKGHSVRWTCVNDFPMEPHCWEGTTVSWELEPDGSAGTTVRLEHSNWPKSLPRRELGSTAFNWALILRQLKSYAETGKSEPVFGKPAAMA